MSYSEDKRSKKGKDDRNKNCRRWTNEEKALFAEVLADPDNNFLVAIDKLALKCSSNEEVFGHIKNCFEVALQDEIFIKNNEAQNFTDKRGNLRKYERLDTSITKLRNQLKTLKREWKNITDRIKNGSGLAPGEEPEWYLVMNPILAETNEEINLASSANETSFVNKEYKSGESDSDEDEGTVDNLEGKNDLNENDGNSSTKKGKSETKNKLKAKVVAQVHQKRNQIRSNKQALSEVAKSIQSMGESQVKRMKMTLEAEEKREERRRQERMEEAEKNRKHEIEIAKIYAAAFASSNQQKCTHSTPSYFPSASPSPHPLSSPQNYGSQDHRQVATSPFSSPSPTERSSFLSEFNDPHVSYFKQWQRK